MRKPRTAKTRKRLTLAALITCYVCHGLGYLVESRQIIRLCPLCHGEGFQKAAA